MATTPKTKRATSAKAKSTPAAPVLSDVAAPDASEQTLKKKEFLARVTASVGDRKGSVKDVAEAVLQILSDAAHRGEDMILPPLGRIRVVKGKEGTQAALTLKLRKITGGGGKKTAAEPLADADEDS